MARPRSFSDTTSTAANENITTSILSYAQVHPDTRRKRALIAGAADGYCQTIVIWSFALLFYVGAVLIDDSTVQYEDFFTAVLAVLFGYFGVGKVSKLEVCSFTSNCYIEVQAAAGYGGIYGEPFFSTASIAGRRSILRCN